VKHLAAFDGPGNGGEANISDSDWLTTYLPPFAKSFEAGALSTMCTYAKLNGVYGCQSGKLLTQWLRGEGTQHFNFSGYVVSDQGCVHECAVRRAAVPPSITVPLRHPRAACSPVDAACPLAPLVSRH
jgi:beta-glucosidase-like glycosyl hydrolase